MITAYGQFYSALYFVNPLINPESKDYLDYYIEDRNFITFTKTQAGQSMGYVQEFAIETD
jgi:hypothetical protein